MEDLAKILYMISYAKTTRKELLDPELCTFEAYLIAT